MKQILILESHEIERLNRGKTLLISTPGGEIALQFDRIDRIDRTEVSQNGHASHGTLKCDICGATTRKNGKPFKSQKGVIRHKVVEHKYRRGGQ